MNSRNTEKNSVEKHTKKIRSRIWMILLSALTPFLFLVIAFVMQADTTNEKLLIVAVFLFAAGVSFLATKLASYTTIERYLDLIDKLDNAKSDFISVASHQLKSPVSSLRYTMDILREGLENKDWETVEEFSKDIENSVMRLDSLTHQLLDVARAEAGSLEKTPEKFSLVSKIDSIKEELRPIAEKDKIKVNCEFEVDNDVSVKIDPGFFYNVLQNLLTNAFKYAPEGSEIVISVKRKTEFAEVEIVNSAEGLSEADLEGLFDKFSRGGHKGKAGDGAGLGLFISKTYVEDWGGSIEAQLLNDPKGKVAFRFTVPIYSKA